MSWLRSPHRLPANIAAIGFCTLALTLSTAHSGCTSQRPPADPPAAQPAPAKAALQHEALRPISEFRVATHGFAFRNSFTGSPLPTSVQQSDSPLVRSMRSAVEANADLPKHFGLCGGMSLAAADFFYAGATVPGMDTPPKAGTPLYEYLYQRQVDSWGAGGLYALRFIQWMRLADDGAEGTIERSRPELARIISQVRAGHMTPVGLVLTRWRAGEKSNEKPWENHQVLCWGVEQVADGTDLHVYDPNYPGDERVVIRVWNCTPDGERIDAATTITMSRLNAGNKATPVRGVFAMPYEPKVPPREPADARSSPEVQHQW